MRLAARDLGPVDRLPVVEGDEVDPAIGQQILDRGGSGSGGSSRVPSPTSASRWSTVSWAHFLFVPITPEGPA